MTPNFWCALLACFVLLTSCQPKIPPEEPTNPSPEPNAQQALADAQTSFNRKKKKRRRKRNHRKRQSSLKTKKGKQKPGPDHTQTPVNTHEKETIHPIRKEGESLDDVVDVAMGNDKPSSTHVLSDHEIQRILRRHQGGLVKCMRAEMKRDPSYRGANVSFLVAPSGKPRNIRVTGGPSSVDTVQCIKGHADKIRFPAHGGLGTRVSLPLRVK